jgi:maltooligosyltrehalose trehalohydrolase
VRTADISPAWVESAKAGCGYRFRLDERKAAVPDPASRFQPEGPHGPSEIVNPNQYRWAERFVAGLSRCRGR